jgi:hypothetical protein
MQLNRKEFIQKAAASVVSLALGTGLPQSMSKAETPEEPLLKPEPEGLPIGAAPIPGEEITPDPEAPGPGLKGYKPRAFLPVVSNGFRTPWPGKGAIGGSCDQLALLKAQWHYVYGTHPHVCPELGIDHVPMIWGWQYVGSELGGNSQYVLAPNEPDIRSQANMRPDEAVVFWQEVEKQCPEPIKLVGLNLAFIYKDWDVRKAALEWLDEWWGLYKEADGNEDHDPPRLDALGIHAYGTFEDCRQAALDAIVWAKAHNVLQVWLTETGHHPCWEGGVEATVEFVWKLLNWASRDSEAARLTRLAWFMTSFDGEQSWWWPAGPACNTSLIDWETKELTPWGEEFSRW